MYSPTERWASKALKVCHLLLTIPNSFIQIFIPIIKKWAIKPKRLQDEKAHNSIFTTFNHLNSVFSKVNMCHHKSNLTIRELLANITPVFILFIHLWYFFADWLVETAWNWDSYTYIKSISIHEMIRLHVHPCRCFFFFIFNVISVNPGIVICNCKWNRLKVINS